MTIPTFVPPKPPTAPLEITQQTRIVSAQFGDGYAQETVDGLNSVVLSANLSWPDLTQSQADEIDAFMMERAGAKAFLWTLPGETVARKWKCRSWPKGYKATGRYSLTAAFQEVFDLA
nr:phage tail protein [uncultured Pseudodesulfovibrio sp.]